MPESNTAFTGSIPELYDGHLGPVLFEPYARDLGRRLSLREGMRILELACGTGIVTRHLLDRLPTGARLTATDLNEGMLAHARIRVAASPFLEWRQADASALPFPDRSFDLVVCQFGVMFFPDKPQAAAEVRRVLAPGGMFVFNVWDSLDTNPMGRISHETIARLFPDDPPDFYQIPFGFHRHEELRALLSGAGFRDVALEVVAFDIQCPDAHHAAIGFVEGNPVSLAIKERGQETGPVVEAVAQALTRELGDKPMRARMQAIVVSGRA